MISIHLPIVSVLINQFINWLVYEVSKYSEKCNFEEPKATVQIASFGQPTVPNSKTLHVPSYTTKKSSKVLYQRSWIQIVFDIFP